MSNRKVYNLLNRVLKHTGKKLKKTNEYMYWSPFVSHHKQKLQINIKTGKWHCWVRIKVDIIYFNYLKKLEQVINTLMN